jgi:hypothetical protein
MAQLLRISYLKDVITIRDEFCCHLQSWIPVLATGKVLKTCLAWMNILYDLNKNDWKLYSGRTFFENQDRWS